MSNKTDVRNGTSDSPLNLTSDLDLSFFVFLITAILAIIVNVAIIWIVWAHRSMKTTTNVYIGNMGIGGLLMTMFAFPFIFPYNQYLSYWEAPGFCMKQEFTTSLGICVFVFSLMMIIVEKYHAITAPDEDLPSIRYRATFNIWFFSFLLSIPNSYFSTLYVGVLHSEDGVCLKEWPNFLGGHITQILYSVLMTFLTYIIPVCIMVYRSAQLGRKMWSESAADFSSTDIEAHKQTVRMMIVQVTVFTILWFPYRLLSFVNEEVMSVYIHASPFLLLFYWMAMSTIIFYPIIYVCMEARFQKKLKKVFRWCPCVDYESKSVKYMLRNADNSPNIVEMYRPLADDV